MKCAMQKLKHFTTMYIHCDITCRAVTIVLLQVAMNRLLVPNTLTSWENSYSRFSDKIFDSLTEAYMFEIVAMVNTFIVVMVNTFIYAIQTFVVYTKYLL